eukprot:TRINITY_DN12750_c0_g1_i1.p1 TRINITY_DN12750_c0_g1~~TRINITY_DN12750_c0_g1_i1.p1  ORF type:complete len:597 (-),score=11.15 TRINITY_DN12750_c0_g1_i1:276-2066(-)
MCIRDRSTRDGVLAEDAVHRRGCRVISGALASTSRSDILLEASCISFEEMARTRAMAYALHVRHSYRDWLLKPPPEPPPSRKNPNQFPYEDSHLRNLDKELDTLLPGLVIRQETAPPDFAQNLLNQIPNISFGTTLDGPQTTSEEKLTASLQALRPHKSTNLRIATDGSAESPCRAACIIKLRGYPPLGCTQACRDNCSSFETEALALRNASTIAVIAMKLAAQDGKSPVRTALFISDSQSVLTQLAQGPHQQHNTLLSQIWNRLMQLADCGVKVHLQFVRSHVGVEENEAVDSLAGDKFRAVDIPEEKCWIQDAISNVKAKIKEKWNTKEGKSSLHRYALVGNRPSPLLSNCPITGCHLSRNQLINLTRARTGESTLFGNFFFRIRQQVNKCRWCHPPTEAVLATKKWTQPIASNEEKARTCKFCNVILVTKRALKAHCATHTDQHYYCFHGCGAKFIKRTSRRSHSNRCKSKPEVAETAAAPEEDKDDNDNDTPEDESQQQPLAPEESISHMLECPHLHPIREQYRVAPLHQRYEWKFFHSLPFLCWLLTCVGEKFDDEVGGDYYYQLSPDDVQSPPTTDSEDSDPDGWGHFND